MSKYTTHSPEETKKIAAEIVKKVWATRGGKSLVLALTGELGAGKTTFAQGVAQFLGVKQTVTSPTFILMKRYEIQEELVAPLGLESLRNLYHFDCYRLESSRDILDLGWEDIMSAGGNLILIEWAEKIKDILSPDTVWIKMESHSENERGIIVES